MTTEFDTLKQEVAQEVAQEVETAAGGHQGGSMDAVYGLGLIGAWIFYIGRATTVSEGALGFFKGLVWPVFLVHGLLVFLDGE